MAASQRPATSVSANNLGYDKYIIDNRLRNRTTAVPYLLLSEEHNWSLCPVVDGLGLLFGSLIPLNVGHMSSKLS